MNIKVYDVKDHDPGLLSFITTKLREYNNKVSPHHLASRKEGAIQNLQIIVEDDNGQWIGGLVAELCWNWLFVDKLWVDDSHRHEGIGSKLLREAERLAAERGCIHAYLTTYEFQARVFYEKHGYLVVGKLEDYPPGSAYYWMSKTF